MSVDAAIRARVAEVPVPEFESTPVVAGPPLAEARVAIVTTAGLTARGGVRLWQPTDGSFTVLPATDRDVLLAHFSPNFDRSGYAADINVVYPIDRLEELSGRGEIGSVAPRNISFMGAQTDATFSTILLDSGPAAAKVLVDDGVDVVLLTPV